MTGIPDAEAAWETWRTTELVPRDYSGMITRKDAFLAGFAAAEGPWREHLAAQLEAVAEGIETNDQEYESGQRWAFFDAARIARGTNES